MNNSRRLLFTSVFMLMASIASVHVASAQDVPYDPSESVSYQKAVITKASDPEPVSYGGTTRTEQLLEMRVLTGDDKGREVTAAYGYLSETSGAELEEGDTIIIQQWQNMDGEMEFLISERYRLPSLGMLLLIFFILAAVFGGRMGVQSVIGMMLSIGVLTVFVVPRILQGDNPLLISLAGSFLIALGSMYLAHGIHRRTTVALMSTFITLALSSLLAIAFVFWSELYGAGSEEAMFLQMGPTGVINLRGLLLGGIIIGALGILDDITTAQTAAVDEISKANPALGFKELYKRGNSIGHEHIASLVNSLALAYAGASLPLLLLFSTQESVPLWVLLNSEFLAEEIVRTLVGSSTLLLAVPISTFLAAKSFAGGRHTDGKGGGCIHSHAH